MTRLPSYRPFQPSLRLDAHQVRLMNTLARRAAHFTVSLGEPAQAWQCSLMPCTTPPMPDPTRFVAQLDWDGSPLSLALPQDAIQRWMESQMPGLAFSSLPRAMATAALDVALHQVMSGLAQSATANLRVLPRASPSDTDPSGSLPLCWTLTLHSSATSTTINATLYGDASTLERLAALAKSLPPSPGPVDVHSLDVDVRVLIGHTRLPASQARTLRHGDVIMLDQCLIGSDGEFWLALAKSSGLRVRPEQGRYLVTQGWTPLMTESDVPKLDTVPDNESSAPDTRQPADAAATGTDTNPVTRSESGEDANTDIDAQTPSVLQDLDDINIDLSFDLGHRRLSLAELQSLQPGEVFDLARPLNDGPVHIRANGTLIGHGELVDIDGHVGVRIFRLGSQS